MGWDRDGTITIPNGQTKSAPYILYDRNSMGPVAVLLIAPETLPETVTVCCPRTSDPATEAKLQDGGTDLVITADEAIQIIEITARSIMLVASGAVAADRVFEVHANNITARP
jgi:hypothetical protein